jgi:uracil-DNA glycosylase
MRPGKDFPTEEPYYESAAPLVPDSPRLEDVRDAAMGCQACHLWRFGTQTVFGEGNPDARIMLIGEQPGDKEDLEGKPFVGPAGQLLMDAMDQAGISREEVYITNAVKHFKWTPAGGRRLHQKPNVREQRACRPWLEAEIARVRPEALLLLGATAAQAVLGADFKLTKNRGRFVESEMASNVLATLHPSAIIRMPEASQRDSAFDSLVEDLRLVAETVHPRPNGYLA